MSDTAIKFRLSDGSYVDFDDIEVGLLRVAKRQPRIIQRNKDRKPRIIYTSKGYKYFSLAFNDYNKSTRGKIETIRTETEPMRFYYRYLYDGNMTISSIVKPIRDGVPAPYWGGYQKLLDQITVNLVEINPEPAGVAQFIKGS